MRYAHIINGIVANIIMADSAEALPGVTLLPALEHTRAGEALLDGALPPAPVSAAVSVPLDAARAQAFEAIRRARDVRLNAGGLIWNGWLVSIDKEATDRMTSQAVQFMAGVCAGVRWKMSDGAYADLDQAGFFAMSAAAGAVVQACYAVEETKRGIVDGLPDAPAVLAWLEIPANLLTGWPDEEGNLAAGRPDEAGR